VTSFSPFRLSREVAAKEESVFLSQIKNTTFSKNYYENMLSLVTATQPSSQPFSYLSSLSYHIQAQVLLGKTQPEALLLAKEACRVICQKV
jgi:hypothetical protein